MPQKELPAGKFTSSTVTCQQCSLLHINAAAYSEPIFCGCNSQNIPLYYEMRLTFFFKVKIPSLQKQEMQQPQTPPTLRLGCVATRKLSSAKRDRERAREIDKQRQLREAHSLVPYLVTSCFFFFLPLQCPRHMQRKRSHLPAKCLYRTGRRSEFGLMKGQLA